MFGNVVCDRIATHIAAMLEPSEATAVGLQVGDALARQIHTRLAFIIVACAAVERPGLLPRKDRSAKTPSVRRAAFSRNLKAQLKATAHRVRHAGKRAICLSCRGGAPWGSLVKWLPTECRGRAGGPSREAAALLPA